MVSDDLERPKLRPTDTEMLTMNINGDINIQSIYAEQAAVALALEDDDDEADGNDSINAVEVPASEVIKPDKRSEFRIAHDREINQMRDRRFVRKDTAKANRIKGFIPADRLSDEQKKGALKCRIVYTVKRPEPGQEKGKAKARLVAQDLKVYGQQPKQEVYAATPTAAGFRLTIASTNIDEGDEISSSDLVTAYLQGFTFEQAKAMSPGRDTAFNKKIMLITYYDPFTQLWEYEWIDGPIYGQQIAGQNWKVTFAYHLVAALQFLEVQNMESVYFHPVRKIIVPCHVDDPLVKTKSSEDTKWFHDQLEAIFDTKGRSILSPDNELDWCSVRITMTPQGDLRMDNKPKIEEYGRKHELDKLPPADYPITKSIVQGLTESRETGMKDSKEDQELVAEMLGQAQWLAQTTHPTIAPAVSMYASLVKDGVKGGAKALKHLHKYIQGQKDKCLMKRKGNREGLKVSSDASHADMYTITKGEEKRSRSGIEVTYDGMPIDWRSQYQKCTGTEYNGDRDLIALSSGEAETYAAADAAKLAMHFKYVCEETDIKVPKKVAITIDAAAAEGFIQNTGKIGRMKHIDLREAWVKDLRDRQHIEFIRKTGPENPADFFTKIITGSQFKAAEDRLMVSLDDQHGLEQLD